MNTTLLTLGAVTAGLALSLYLHKKFKQMDKPGWRNPEALPSVAGGMEHPLPPMKISAEAGADIITFPGVMVARGSISDETAAKIKAEWETAQVSGEPVQVLTEPEAIKILLKADAASIQPKKKEGE